METLNDQDLDWLIKVQARLIAMRKREAANTASKIMDNELTDAIEAVDEFRTMLAARLGRRGE